MAIGQTFAPTGNQGKPRPGPGGQGGGAQQAIKVLNLRIPRVVGAGAAIPQPLLMSPGSGAIPMPGGGSGPVPGEPVPFGLEELIRRMFGNGGNFGSAPDPQFVPIGPPQKGPFGAPPTPPDVSWEPMPTAPRQPGPMPNPRRDSKYEEPPRWSEPNRPG